MDGRRWKTIVWRDHGRRTLLAVLKRIRGGKEEADFMVVEVEPA